MNNNPLIYNEISKSSKNFFNMFVFAVQYNFLVKCILIVAIIMLLIGLIINLSKNNKLSHIILSIGIVVMLIGFSIPTTTVLKAIEKDSALQYGNYRGSMLVVDMENTDDSMYDVSLIDSRVATQLTDDYKHETDEEQFDGNVLIKVLASPVTLSDKFVDKYNIRVGHRYFIETPKAITIKNETYDSVGIDELDKIDTHIMKMTDLKE